MKIKNNLEISDLVDVDGEVEIEVNECEMAYINKGHALKIISHLIKVFDLDADDLI